MILHGLQRTIVTCEGDIGITWFYNDATKGIGWVRMVDGEKGEIGRKMESFDPADLTTCKGVLIAAKDPRSFDVLSEMFKEIADFMRLERPDTYLQKQEELCKAISDD